MSKYGSKKTTCLQGHFHPSKREADRCNVLTDMARKGEIRNLKYQPVYPIVIDGSEVVMRNGHAAKYTADFQYYQGDKTVIEDVKGMITQDYRLRRALVEHIYKIRVTEV